jgi:hypothetical protein
MDTGKCYDNVAELLSSLFSNAVQSLWIATAFLDSCGTRLVKEAISRGVSVKLLVSSEVGPEVLRDLEGAEIRIYSETFMHMKLYIADGRAYSGSANLTCPVLKGLNVETLCDVDPASAVKIFNSYWAKASPYVPVSAEHIPKCLLEARDLGDRISFKNTFEGYELIVYKIIPYSVLLTPIAKRMVYMAPQSLIKSSYPGYLELKYALPPRWVHSVDVGSITSLWKEYSDNAKNVGHEDLPEEDKVRVNKILSMLSSMINSLENSMKTLVEKQTERVAREIIDIIADKVSKLTGKNVEVRLSGPSLSPYYSIAENTLTIRIAMSANVGGKEAVKDLANLESKIVEEIKATSKTYVDKLLEDISKATRELLQEVRRCGIASKTLIDLTFSLYIGGREYKYNPGEVAV